MYYDQAKIYFMVNYLKKKNENFIYIWQSKRRDILGYFLLTKKNYYLRLYIYYLNEF